MPLLPLIIGSLAGFLLSGILFMVFLQKRTHQMEIQKTTLTADHLNLIKEIEALRSSLTEAQNQLLILNREIATRNQEVKQLTGVNEEKQKNLQETLVKMNSEFKILANEILEEKTKKFTELNTVRLSEILLPLKEQITGFEKKVEDTYQKSLHDQVGLQAELKKLQDLNIRISDEARNLSRALKGDVKKQGNWGEMILEKILERSGLQKGEEYTLQESLQNEEGRRIQPDAMVHLPDDKHIIIDAKVSLVAYDKLVNEEDEEVRKIHLRDHLVSLRRHVKELSEKNYAGAKNIQSPDFVLLFIPIEASFSIAVREDQQLFNEAWEKQIVIVSPTTLLATLMTISSLWKQAKQSRHALLIADQGAKLYDKLIGFFEDLVKLGERLESTQRMYDESMKKLKTGTGNLVKRTQDMKELGLKSAKQLPESLVDYDSSDD